MCTSAQSAACSAMLARAVLAMMRPGVHIALTSSTSQQSCAPALPVQLQKALLHGPYGATYGAVIGQAEQ